MNDQTGVAKTAKFRDFRDEPLFLKTDPFQKEMGVCRRGMGMPREKLKKIELSQQKNPQVIREIIDGMIREKFNDSTPQAARELNAMVASTTRRRLHPQFSRDSLDRLLSDKSIMTYSHLAAFARYYKLPTGLLLIYSRMLSEMTDTVDGEAGSAARALQTLEAVLAGLEALRDVLVEAEQHRVKDLGLFGLERMRNAYLSAMQTEADVSITA